MQKIDTRICLLSFDGKVLRSEMKEDIIVEVEDVLGNYKKVLDLVQGQKYISLVTTAGTNSITKEAREVNDRPEMFALCVAQAIIIESLPVRILGNFLIKLFKKHCPQKIFANEETAMEWLNYHWELEHAHAM